jgi:adenylyltransferase/sulfurtransferase
VLPGTVGAVQATETIKLLLNIGSSLVGRLLTYDALEMRFREVRLKRDPNCPLCGAAPTITDLSIHGGGAIPEDSSTGSCGVSSFGNGSSDPSPTMPAQKSGG